MGFGEILELVDRVKASVILILCHHNADPDAVCSAYAIKSLLKRLRPEAVVKVASPGISKLSRYILPFF